MDDILEKLGLSTRITVGVSISANNLIEMICVDKSSRTITKYAARELKYNNAIREIVDYDELSTALFELFRELNLQPKQCNVILNMPNVQFAFMHLPLILPDDQVTNAIASEVEQLYLFKRHEPVITWSNIDQSQETDKRYVVYAALQDSVLQSIKEVLAELGARLVVIENSHSSMLKGVQYSRILEDEMQNPDTSTNILLITANSYAIFCMKGNKVIDYYEEPLAIKSFTNDEVYLAISSAATGTLEHYPTRNLLIISETNEVSSELLADKMNFDGAIKYLDRNKYTEQAFMPVDYSIVQNYLPHITLESVGVAAYNYEDFPVKFNFLSDIEGGVAETLSINIFGTEVEINRKTIISLVGIIIGVLLLLLVILWFTFNSMNNKMKEEITVLTQQSQQYETKIKESEISVDAADIYTVSQRINQGNKESIALFNGLGSDIPNEVWIESYRTSSLGDVVVNGKSIASEHIYTFFKGLKRYNPSIYISKLQLDIDSNNPIPDLKSGDNLYSFEIISTKNQKPEIKEGEEQDGQNPGEEQQKPNTPLFPFFNTPSSPPSAMQESMLKQPEQSMPINMPPPPAPMPDVTLPPPISAAP